MKYCLALILVFMFLITFTSCEYVKKHDVNTNSIIEEDWQRKKNVIAFDYSILSQGFSTSPLIKTEKLLDAPKKTFGSISFFIDEEIFDMAEQFENNYKFLNLSTKNTISNIFFITALEEKSMEINNSATKLKSEEIPLVRFFSVNNVEPSKIFSDKNILDIPITGALYTLEENEQSAMIIFFQYKDYDYSIQIVNIDENNTDIEFFSAFISNIEFIN